MAKPRLIDPQQGAGGVSHFNVVDTGQYSSDGTTTGITTAWTAGTAVDQVDSGDLLIVEAWTTSSTAIATPSGYTALLSGSAVGSLYANVFYKTAGGSEANITLNTVGNAPLWVRAFAAAGVSAIDSVQTYYGSNPWYYVRWLPYYQPSVDGSGASSDWVLLHTMLHSSSTGDTRWRGQSASIQDASDTIPDYAWDNIAYSELHDGAIGSYSHALYEYPGEQFDGADVQLRAAYTANSNPGGGYYLVYGFTMAAGTMGSADIANLSAEVQYTPLTDSAGPAQVANLPVSPLYTPLTDSSGPAELANLSLSPFYTPGDSWDMANLFLWVMYTPSVNEISTITMLMENPDLVAQGGEEIVEYRYPDVGSALRAVKVYAAQGEMQRKWQMLIDLRNVLNVDNEPASVDVVFDYLTSAANNELIVPISDFMGNVERDGSDDADAMLTNVTLVGENIAVVEMVEVN